VVGKDAPNTWFSLQRYLLPFLMKNSPGKPARLFHRFLHWWSVVIPPLPRLSCITRTPNATALAKAGWREVYRDETAVIFVRGE
jgi:hypothetical protein